MEHDDYTAMVAIAKNEETDRLRAEITQLRAELAEQKADAMKWFGVALEQKHELAAERELAADLCFTLSAFVAKYGGTNAARQVKDYRDHCATRRNK